MRTCQCFTTGQTCATNKPGDKVTPKTVCATAKHRGICKCDNCKCHEIKKEEVQ